MGAKVFWIDIVGTCNLRCPSCAVGNYSEEDFSGSTRRIGFMEFEKFRKILAKIKKENPDNQCRIEIYNWGEPLLHPDAAKFVREINSYSNFLCGISSNLSHRRADLTGVLKENPHSLRISLSGFHKESYSQTHVRGDIELVKANMVRIREILDAHKLKTIVTVAYHVYRHNAGEELELMRKFCDELGFLLTPDWANFYPLEKVERYFEGGASDAELDLIGKLVFSPEEQLEYAKKAADQPCKLQDHTAINHDGTVALCCATYDPATFIADDFLTSSASELMAAKLKSATCDRCIGAGYHAMMCGYGMAEKDAIGADRVPFADGWKLSSGRLVRSSPHTAASGRLKKATAFFKRIATN